MRQLRERSALRTCFHRLVDILYVAAVYLPEELVGDVGVVHARIVSHDVLLDHVGSDLRLFDRNVNFRVRRTAQKILMNDDEATSINGEASEN